MARNHINKTGIAINSVYLFNNNNNNNNMNTVYNTFIQFYIHPYKLNEK